MKLRKLLPIVFLAVAGLSACNQPTSSDEYTLEVTNKAAIEAEWHVGDAARTLTVAATKNKETVNATQLLNSEIFVTSSNEQVLTALGFVLTPVSMGTTTVTVKYHNVEQKLDLNIQKKLTCIDKYGTVHAGTEDDPFDNADAETLDIETSTGDVRGTLGSPKIFDVRTDTGKVNYPTSTEGGLCKIRTDTGDVNISFK